MALITLKSEHFGFTIETIIQKLQIISGEILRDLLYFFLQKISLKSVKWEGESHAKMQFKNV